MTPQIQNIIEKVNFTSLGKSDGMVEIAVPRLINIAEMESMRACCLLE